MVRKLTSSDIKSIEFEGLLILRDIFEKNGLKYTLGYGTLLGAVRHKGFIPWDDDIDIWMPREDFDKFLRLFSQKTQKNWRLYSAYYDKGYYFEFAKFCNMKTVIEPSRFISGLKYGICVDIFPLDSCNFDSVDHLLEKLDIIRKKYNRIFSRYHALRVSYKGFTFIDTCKFIISSFWYGSFRTQLKKYNQELSNISEPSESKYVFCCLSGIWSVFNFDDLEIKKMSFEGELFNVPQNTHSVLSTLYGEYLKLPPPPEQRGTHEIDAYTIE